MIPLLVSSRRIDLLSCFPKANPLPRMLQGKETSPADGSQPAPVPAVGQHHRRASSWFGSSLELEDNHYVDQEETLPVLKLFGLPHN